MAVDIYQITPSQSTTENSQQSEAYVRQELAENRRNDLIGQIVMYSLFVIFVTVFVILVKKRRRQSKLGLKPKPTKLNQAFKITIGLLAVAIIATLAIGGLILLSWK